MHGCFPFRKKSGNYGVNFREFLYGKKFFHCVTNFACVEVRVALRDTNIVAELILMLDEPLAADEEEMLTDSDDEEEICFIGAIFLFIVPIYSIDEF